MNVNIVKHGPNNHYIISIEQGKLMLNMIMLPLLILVESFFLIIPPF